MKISWNRKPARPIRNPFRAVRGSSRQDGFTLLEVLVTIVLLTVGMFGLIASVNSVIRYQKHSSFMTEATLHCANKLEEVKRLATNEPTGGTYGFDYLVGTYPTADSMTQVDDFTYTKTETVNGMTRVLTLTADPFNNQASFVEPDSIPMVEAVAQTSWTEDNGNTFNVELSSVLHRRQFLQ